MPDAVAATQEIRKSTDDFGGCRTGKKAAAADLLVRIFSLGFSCDEDEEDE